MCPLLLSFRLWQDCVRFRMTQTVFALHTGFAVVEPVRKYCEELLPGVRLMSIADDSLLADVRAAGSLTPSVTQRIVGYGMLAQSAGADAILNCCSSVGDAADVLARVVDIPVVKIDEKMAEEAVRRGTRVGVIATVATTLDPTERLILGKAEAASSAATVRRYLVEGAFDVLLTGDSAGHDRMVMDTIERASAENDAVVLAQASMARLVPLVSVERRASVLASLPLGIIALKEVLARKGQ